MAKETKKEQDALEQNVIQDVVTAKEPTIPLSEVQELIRASVKEALALQTEAKKEVEKPQQSYFQEKENTDEIPGLENFEFKDRTYVSLNGSKAITQDVLNRHKAKSPCQWLNPRTKKLMTLRYSSNQSSIFVEEQTGEVLNTYIIMKDGMLRVPKENVTLQKFLAIHPHNGTRFEELDPAKENQKVIDAEDLRFEAEAAARKLSGIEQDAIARLLCFNYKEDWDSSTIKREIYQKAKENPTKFLKLAKDDTLKIKGIIKTAMHREFIAYRNFAFYDGAGDLIVSVNRNDDEIETMVSYLNSNKGQKLYEYLKQAVC
jgi:hypothetical protein